MRSRGKGQRNKFLARVFALVLGASCAAWGQGRPTSVADMSPQTVQFVMVEPGVKLEVLDWGGTGRPVVLLAGLGSSAHVFDKFATKLTGKYHVFGITRRGMETSNAPTPALENYSADRLGDDVIAVLNHLDIVRPVLVGHSIAGEELSSIGSRFSARVAGLVYLDAGYSYALYNGAKGDFSIDTHQLELDLAAFRAAILPDDAKKALHAVQQELPRVQTELAALLQDWDRAPMMTAEQKAKLTPEMMKQRAVGQAILNSGQRYTTITCPVLAIFAEPHSRGAKPATPDEDAKNIAEVEPQARLFEELPNAKVVRLAHADHFVFSSNEADVLRDMDTFIGDLK